MTHTIINNFSLRQRCAQRMSWMQLGRGWQTRATGQCACLLCWYVLGIVLKNLVVTVHSLDHLFCYSYYFVLSGNLLLSLFLVCWTYKFILKRFDMSYIEYILIKKIQKGTHSGILNKHCPSNIVSHTVDQTVPFNFSLSLSI